MTFPQPVDCSSPEAASLFPATLARTGCVVLIDPPIGADVVGRIYEEWLTFFATDAKHRYTVKSARSDGHSPHRRSGPRTASPLTARSSSTRRNPV